MSKAPRIKPLFSNLQAAASKEHSNDFDTSKNDSTVTSLSFGENEWNQNLGCSNIAKPLYCSITAPF